MSTYLNNGLPAAATALRGERRVATVLIADVKDSTALLERLGSEAWVAVMNRIFQIAGAEIYRFGGEIDQFRGDGLVAFFGTHIIHEDDPERAVMAALSVQESLGRYAEELTHSDNVTLRVRIGLNTGEVIVAEVGDLGRHLESTAMGEAVALAARMEAAAEPGTVLVSQNTHHLVESVFDWEALGEIAAKGVTVPVAVYRPLRRRALTRPRGIAGLQSPLVGRQVQFDALQAAVRRVREGQGGIVTIFGEAGIGKSRLVTEVRLREARGSDRPLIWVEGRSLSQGSGTAYLPWADLLHKLLRLPRSGPSPELASTLRARLSDLGVSDPAIVAAAIARILTVPEAGEALPAPDSPSSGHLKQTTFAAVIAVIERIAARRPLVLAFEDLHWADPTSLELLGAVLPVTRAVPLLLVCISRPPTESEAHEGLGAFLDLVETAYGAQHSRLVLEVLRPRESTRLVENLLSSAATSMAPPERGAESGAEPSVPDTVSNAVVTRSGGNPFHVEEIIRALIDEGTLVCDPASCRWQTAGDGAALTMPGTLRGVLDARIDRLPADTRRTLKVAAVCGRFFSLELLQAMAGSAGLDAAALPDHLATLEGAQMVRQQPELPGTGYVFKHQLLQEAAYASLLGSELRALHRSVAEALTTLVFERSLAFERSIADVQAPEGQHTALGSQHTALESQHTALESQHTALESQRTALEGQRTALESQRTALEGQRAALESQRTADQAAQLAYHWEAAGEPARAIPYLLEMARYAQASYANDEAITAFRHVLSLTVPDARRRRGGPDLAQIRRWRVAALRGLGKVLFATGKVAEAEAQFREAIALARETGLPLPDLIRLYHWLGEALFWQGRTEERLALGLEGLALLDQEIPSVELALMNQMVAIGHMMRPAVDEYRDYTLRTAAFIGDLPYVPELQPAYEHVVGALVASKRTAEAVALLETLGRKVDLEQDLLAAAAIHRQWGELASALGDLEGALAAYEEVLALDARVGDVKHLAWALGDAARFALELGDITRAVALMTELERNATDSGNFRRIEYLLQGSVRRAMIDGQPERGFGDAQRLLDHYRETGNALAPAMGLILLGRLALHARQPDDAARHFTEALALCRGNANLIDVPIFTAILNGLTEARPGEEGTLVQGSPAGLGRLARWGLDRATLPAHGTPDWHEPFAAGPRARLLLSGWRWIDPLGGSRAEVHRGLAIHARNGRGLWQANLSAPRLLRPIDGDALITLRVGPAPGTAAPAMGGLLLWQSERDYVRISWGESGTRSILVAACTDNVDRAWGAGALPGAAGPEGVLLHLDRRGDHVRAFCSLDGAEWWHACDVPFAAGAAYVGPFAVGTIDRTIYQGAFPDGTITAFHDFTLWS